MTTTFSQVASVGNLAFRIATSFTIPPYPGTPVDKSKLAMLNAAWQSVKNDPNVQEEIEASRVAFKAFAAYKAIDATITATTEEDLIRVAATLATILDPTGVAQIVSAYTYPTCQKLFLHEHP
jgi:hypothetical protein